MPKPPAEIIGYTPSRKLEVFVLRPTYEYGPISLYSVVHIPGEALGIPQVLPEVGSPQTIELPDVDATIIGPGVLFQHKDTLYLELHNRVLLLYDPGNGVLESAHLDSGQYRIVVGQAR